MIRVPRLSKRAKFRIVVGEVAILAIVAGTVSVLQLRDVQRQQDVRHGAALAQHTVDVRLRSDLLQLEAIVDQTEAATARDLSDAQLIDHSVTKLQQLRAQITTVRNDVKLAQADRAKRQQVLDILLGCRDTLDQATEQLQTPGVSATAATSVLNAGRATCQQALSVIDRRTAAVHPYDFPDPAVITYKGTYYAYGTNGPGGTIQALRSHDLKTWAVLPSVLAGVPPWAKPAYTWAPSVQQVGSSAFVLYYAVRDRGSNRQCISSAISFFPTGQFIDVSKGPIVCQTQFGGSIDPSTYTDEFGFQHLLWKSEGETVGGRATIWTQIVAYDGRRLAGTPIQLLAADERWQDKVIENPSMAKVGDTWILLYAGNHWNTPGYATAYAICKTSVGPCTPPPDNVVLQSSGAIAGPGGAQFFRSRGGSTLVAYAAWEADQIGYPNVRRLHLARAQVKDGRLVLTGL